MATFHTIEHKQNGILSNQREERKVSRQISQLDFKIPKFNRFHRFCFPFGGWFPKRLQSICFHSGKTVDEVLKVQSVATIQKVCRGIFQASFRQLSTRLDIYNLVASAAPDIQERIIAEVKALKADGQELYKRKRKMDDDEKDEKEAKRKKLSDAAFQVTGIAGTEMDIDSDQSTR